MKKDGDFFITSGGGTRDWRYFISLTPEQYLSDNDERILAFDSLKLGTAARYPEGKLQVKLYATYVRVCNLHELYRINPELAEAEVWRMAHIDSQVKMLNTTQLHFNLMKWIDFLANGKMYAFVNKMDSASYQNESYMIEGRLRKIDRLVPLHHLLEKVRNSFPKHLPDNKPESTSLF